MTEALQPGALFERLVLEPGAIRQVPHYLKERGFRQLVLVVDENTYQAAGKELELYLRNGETSIVLCRLEPNAAGDVVADEVTLIQLMLEVEQGSSDALMAVGSGTIHDVVRFVSHKCSIPFISVPTAPSVDGFTSAGAPIIIRGVKKTIPAVPPIAIFADLDILQQAPQHLVAAGFGDMLGKYTSLFDWQYSHHIAGEPYDEQAAMITERALQSCVDYAEDIGHRTEVGIRVLMTALIESGIAMLMFGQSHPASGAEHHVSHYWEMEYLRRGNRALLHGAKVGVACAEISRLYHQAAGQHNEDIQQWMARVPSETQIRNLLKLAGGPSTIEELGIDAELLRRSLAEAHHVRLNRHTFLRTLNEI